jgi:hypothetical protein
MLGQPGSTAIVHDVNGHPGPPEAVVAKVFHSGTPKKDVKKEKSNLKAVGEYHGKTQKDGQHIILATKKPGKPFPETDAWKNAGADKTKRKAVLDKAKKLVEEKNTHHAKEHGIIHTYVGFTYISTHRHL